MVVFGNLADRNIWETAGSGKDEHPVVPESLHKSVSSERTLPEDTDDVNLLRMHLLSQAEEVAKELRREEAVKLLQAYKLTRKVRLVGVGTSGFLSAAGSGRIPTGTTLGFTWIRGRRKTGSIMTDKSKIEIIY